MSLSYGARLISLLSLPLMVLAQDPAPPQLNGAHFRITALQEHGFLDIENAHDANNADNSQPNFSGYLIDMMEALSRPDRANFTYDLLPPSGYGSLCNPQLNSTQNSSQAFDPSYRTQYNCGATDVNDGPNTTYATDMYLGMYYVTPARQLVNQFTIPFSPPSSGRLAMFGTATGISDFEALTEQQQRGQISPSVTCGPAGTALIDSVVESFPGLQVRGIYGGENEIYQAFVDQSCQVYITDGPIAAQFVLRRSRRDECTDATGAPIGVIGDPMHFGLSHYAIGIRQDIDPRVAHTLSYWMNILMTCNPLDPQGPCPDGNFASLYQGRGGTGEECGYVLYPNTDQHGVSTGGLAGIVIVSVALIVVILYTAWHRYHLSRQKRRYAKKSKAAMAQAAREREFNEYMAHEIRNPLASAIAAISFVSSKTSDSQVVPNPEHRALIKSDINVMDSSLQFVNELLRNMLDLHRTQAGHEIKLNLVPTDILRDIFEPVSTILFMRGASVKIETIINNNSNSNSNSNTRKEDSDDDDDNTLVIMADRMRLKQLCLNLASNSSKFVQQGFIRLRAQVVTVPREGSTSPSTTRSLSESEGDVEDQLHSNGHAHENGDHENKHSNNFTTGGTRQVVQIFVEDSGPGIPEEKRKQLFTKFQDSLDILNQGTGIGLAVCKKLSEAMGGTLSLDDDFDSGVTGCPGTSFRLQLPQEPLDLDLYHSNHLTGHSTTSITGEKDDSGSSSFRRSSMIGEDLPENIKVLFVDDDMMLRKMFTRVLKMAAPTWAIQEASNGETALKIVGDERFDLIFVDQYMASVEKQLLGTETIQAMRAKGVDSIICGLSANDLEEQFLEAGANAFMSKPFPCNKDVLRAALVEMLPAPEPSPPLK